MDDDSSIDLMNNNTTKGKLSAIGFLSMVYFLVCGSSYGTEDLASSIPPLFAIIAIIVVPWFWSLPIALITAEMATTYPHESGFVYWSKKAWGEFISFLDGWFLNWIIIIDQAIYPKIFEDYLRNIFHLTYLQGWGICIGFIIVCFILNLFGVESVGTSSIIFSILSLSPFLIYFSLGFFSTHFDSSRIFVTKGEWNLGIFMSVMVWSTCGYDYAGFLGTDLVNPKKNFPRVMTIAVFLMTVTYLLPIITTISTYEDIASVTEGYYPKLAENLGFGKWLPICMIIGGFLSCAGTFNAYLRTSSTALRGMAKKQQAPAIFNWFPHLNVPITALIFYCSTTVVLVLFDFTVLVNIESILFCVHSMVLCSDVIRLRFIRPNTIRPFAIPGGKAGVIFIGSLPFIISLILLVTSNWLHLIISLLILIWGMVLYWVVFVLLGRPKYSAEKEDNDLETNDDNPKINLLAND